MLRLQCLLISSLQQTQTLTALLALGWVVVTCRHVGSKSKGTQGLSDSSMAA